MSDLAARQHPCLAAAPAAKLRAASLAAQRPRLLSRHEGRTGPGEMKCKRRAMVTAKRRRLVDGFRWVCTEGKAHCDKCAPNCGKEFLHDAEEGQASVEGMPEPPAHPHCRCKLVLLDNVFLRLTEIASDHSQPADIHGVDPFRTDEVRFETPGLSERFNTGCWGWWGLVYCTDGREYTDGPTYGNYGGGSWRFGMNDGKIAAEAAAANLTVDEYLAENYKPPIDSMDSIYEDHDYCYDKGGNQPFLSGTNVDCDKAMIKSLENLDEDPKKWANPPQREEDVEYAKKYRDSAIAFFQAKVDYARLLEKYGEEYMKGKYMALSFAFSRKKTEES